MYFSQCIKPEHIKKLYRELAMIHHPDRGGDIEVMKEINRQYHEALKSYDGFATFSDENKAYTYKYNQETEQAVMDKIGELLALQLRGVHIALIGTWIWVTGETKPVKDSLKGAGLSWNANREAWCWHLGGYRRLRQSSANFSQLAQKYGYSEFSDQKRVG